MYKMLQRCNALPFPAYPIVHTKTFKRTNQETNLLQILCVCANAYIASCAFMILHDSNANRDFLCVFFSERLIAG